MTSKTAPKHTRHPFERLTPSEVVDALSALGLEPDGRITSLSSYENRVYACPQEDAQETLVAKFYRPGRWTREQIQEEHDFALELLREEVPMVAPWVLHGQSLHALCLTEPPGDKVLAAPVLGLAKTQERDQSRSAPEGQVAPSQHEVDFWFSVSPSRGGRMPELDDFEVLEWLGRFIARLHSVGQAKSFHSRPQLDVQSHGWAPRDFLLNQFDIAPAFKSEWSGLTQRALEAVEKAFDVDVQSIRLHGDCHPGNVLWTPLDKDGHGGPHFVDLDDARMGPAVQDLWMLMGGQRQEQTASLSALLEGYESIRAFDRRELALIEPLRTLRMIHYSAWLAQRTEDPAFARHFSWFASDQYWHEQVTALSEQIQRMQEPLLFV